MSIIKNDQISLYCHFNKMIKGPGTSFHSPALSQIHFRNVCHTTHWCLTKFHFDSTQDSKEINISVTSIMSMPLMTSQILKSGFHETFFLQIKKNHKLHIRGYFLAKLP